MRTDFRALIRVFLCGVFIASLFGGLGLLTALMFDTGHTLFAVVFGLVLAVLTATALGLIALALSLSKDDQDATVDDFAAQLG